MFKPIGIAFVVAALSLPLRAQIATADPILRTFMEGESAREAGDYTGLLDAAVILDALGATPAEGQEDVAAEWTQQAHDNGVTHSRLGARGRALGPAYRRGSLPARARLTMQQLFLGGQQARIALAARDAQAGLMVQIKDSQGGLLCEKVLDDAQAECAWLPDFTGRVDILIENRGPAPARFFLLMR